MDDERFGGRVTGRDNVTLEIGTDRYLDDQEAWVSVSRIDQRGRREFVADLDVASARLLIGAVDRAAHVVERRSLLWGWFARA